MRTDGTKKSTTVAKITVHESHENAKNSRRTLKVIQCASDKENLVGRSRIIDKDIKLASENETKRKKFADKYVQTEAYEVTVSVTVEDLTSDEPSENYWRKLAEKRGDQLNDSLQENERLKENIESLQEENRICKEMLDESKTLVEILQEMIGDNDPPEETTESN